MKIVPTDESCHVCGNELEIHTEASQEGVSDGWLAFDGDKAECPECGFQGWVCADEDGAYINWDETSEHNLKCADIYEKKREG